MTSLAVRQKIERGVKRRCATCDTLFYDLLHYPIQCPKCGEPYKAPAKGSLASTAKRLKASTPRPKARAAKTEKPKRQKARDEERADLDERSDGQDLLLDNELDDE